MRLKAIKEKVEEADTTKIFFTDLNGRHRSLPVNPRNIETIIEKGIGFDGSSIAGITTVDDSDRLLLPVPESLRLVGFKEEKLAFFIGKIQNAQGSRSKSDPRAVLENTLDQAESEYGCRFLLGPEHEFFLLRGEAEKIGELQQDKTFADLTIEAGYCLEGFGIVSGFIGEGLTDVFSRWSKLLGG